MSVWSEHELYWSDWSELYEDLRRADLAGFLEDGLEDLKSGGE